MWKTCAVITPCGNTTRLPKVNEGLTYYGSELL